MEPSVVDMSDNGKVDPCASDNELGYLDDHPLHCGGANGYRRACLNRLKYSKVGEVCSAVLKLTLAFSFKQKSLNGRLFVNSAGTAYLSLSQCSKARLSSGSRTMSPTSRSGRPLRWWPLVSMMAATLPILTAFFFSVGFHFYVNDVTLVASGSPVPMRACSWWSLANSLDTLSLPGLPIRYVDASWFPCKWAEKHKSVILWFLLVLLVIGLMGPLPIC